MSEWIKCDDKMPDFDVDVLVYDGKHIYIDYVYEEWNSKGKVFFASLDRVTHWMPLPATPTEVK